MQATPKAGRATLTIVVSSAGAIAPSTRIQISLRVLGSIGSSASPGAGTFVTATLAQPGNARASSHAPPPRVAHRRRTRYR